MITTKLSSKKKMRNTLFITFLILLLLIGRIGFIQFVQGEELSSLAYQQQTLDRSINPKRGTIFDSTGKNVLAVSSTVETVTVNPGNIAKENKEKVARILSEIFELDYETVLKKVSKRSSIETIVKKVEKEKTDKLRVWMEQNGITTGINIDEDTKRYYPYSTIASQIIGFCGSDNQGLDGIEAKYDNELKGEQGAIQRHTDAKGGEIGEEGENYISAIDGNDLVLTIDLNIQSIVEKYLEEACIDNACTDGGNIVVMNPKTGDILAMATYPSYNLNEPYTINDSELLAVWDTLEQSEKTTALQKMWRNKAISDTYEPGSVFKLITALGIIIGAIILVAGVVFVQQAERRVPVQYSKKVVGRKMVGAQSTHIPLKLAMAGVMPVIFASSFMTFPAMIIQIFVKDIANQTGFLAGLYKFSIATSTSSVGWGYSLANALVYLLLIIGFTFFYTYATFNPAEVSNNIKKNGGFIPGIRAGKPTTEYLSSIISKLTWFGGFFLALIAILPMLLRFTNLNIAFGGTSILIVVGVALETVQQLEAQLVMRHYKGFLE